MSLPAYSYAVKNYCLLTKPGIILGNVITTAAGFALASRGHFDPLLFFATIVGLSLVIASASVFNNYIDRHLDEKMERTKKRALVLGLIPKKSALVFACVLVFFGTGLLVYFANVLTTVIALFGFFVYVVLYTYSKYHSIHGTLIGSIAGAVPPVVGYCAVSNQFDSGAFILFIMLAMWQMPHFFAIAIYRLDDYQAASIPVLPINKGMQTAKIHMMLYIVAFMIAAFMLTFFEYTGRTYLIVTSIVSLCWLFLSIKGFWCSNDRQWAKQMFRFSLVVVMALCISIPFTII